MSKGKRFFWWLFSNAVFCLLLWYGTLGDVSGAWNVVVFMIWFNFTISWVALSKKFQDEMRKKGPPAPIWLDGLLDTAITCFLVWQGHWVLGLAYMLHSLLMHSMYAKIEETAP